VSLNLCADQLVLQLLERRRIASISFVGADPLYSPVAEEAAGIPLNHGQAEEV
ncbi:MAG: ABC transporter substrate-binding protein, partial [Desulfuromonadales bacterium]|nr:ABC transporter substrate-binding protein [Desulfuromonadales bacterium]NIS39533.1 ABC transporter substrate-binding protein [Desulfuromonadales bacterium]